MALQNVTAYVLEFVQWEPKQNWALNCDIDLWETNGVIGFYCELQTLPSQKPSYLRCGKDIPR